MKNFLMFPLNLSKPARIKLKGNSGRQAQPWQAPEEFCNTTPTLITVNCNLKLMFFENATKLEKNLPHFFDDSGGGAGIKKHGKFYFVAFSEYIS